MGDAKANPARPRAAVEEFATYLRRNAGQIVDCGERHRACERTSTGFVESAVDQVVPKRFSKRQSTRWTQRGAHFTSQTGMRVLNGELEDAFRRRWPGFQPPPKAGAANERERFVGLNPPVRPACRLFGVRPHPPPFADPDVRRARPPSERLGELCGSRL